MADQVMVFGAGINRSIRGFNGAEPPLATDFFQQVFRHDPTGQTYRLRFRELVLSYIRRYWKLDLDDLKHQPFDLEECFTLLELQYDDARARQDDEAASELLRTYMSLAVWLGEYLDGISSHALGSADFQALGMIIHESRASADEGWRHKEGDTLLLNAHWGHELPDIKGILLEPPLIPPVLHKNVHEGLVGDLWDQARAALSGCRRLVVGGYSFPPTDFHVRRLFLECFEDQSPEEVVVIDRRPEVCDTVRRLCHSVEPVQHFSSLQDFVAAAA